MNKEDIIISLLKEIDENIDNVNDSEGTNANLEELTITSNGIYTPQEGVDGFSKVTAEFDMSNVKTATLQQQGNIPNIFTELDASGWDVSELTSINHLFNGCYNLVKLGDLSRWDMSNKTNTASMFNNCRSLTNIGDISNWDIRGVKNCSYMFCGCESLELPSLNFEIDSPDAIKEMFSNCKLITIKSLRNVNVSNVNDLSSVFSNCSSITSLDLQGWDMRKATNLRCLFYGCSSMSMLDLTGSQTSSLLTSLDQTWTGCGSLISILGISNWDTSSVTTMQWLFRYCTKLVSLDLQGWDLTNITNNINMFDKCSSLTSLRVGNGWNKGCDLSTTGLGHDGLVQFFNDLPTISDSQTIALGATKQALLSAAEIAIATNKNWTIS